jgi:hypothetical protein
MTALVIVRRLIPLLLVTALGAAGVLALGRPWLSAAAPALYEGLAPPLVGVVNTTPPAPPTLSNIEAGRTQAAAMAAFNDAIPQRSAIVRGFNDLLWRTTGGSYMSLQKLLTGRGGVLSQVDWLLSYCGQIERPRLEAIATLTRRLRRVQDWLDARGTPFAYLLAPTKAPFTRDSFGERLPCDAEGDEPAYAAGVATLRSAGVRVVAGREVLRANPSSIPFYPQHGLHWNELGAGLVTRELVSTLRSAGAALPEFRYDVAMLPSERGYDVDLLLLMNLAHVPSSPPAPEVAPAVSADPRLRLATASDSFMTGVIDLLQRGRFFRHVDAFNYLILERRSWEPNLTPHPLDPDSPTAFDPLLTADVMVLEEADHRIGGPFVEYFLTLMEHAMANGGQGLPPSSFSR